MDEEHLVPCNFAGPDDGSALFGWEEIDDIERFENHFADTVDAPDTLDDPDRIPGYVVVDDHASPVEVETFRDSVSGEEDIVIVFLD